MLRSRVVAALVVVVAGIRVRSDTCDIGTRVDCGEVGTDQGHCESKGCCWSLVDNQPRCSCAAGPTPTPGPESNHSNSTFVQLFEWSWADIATECEQWLGPKGFTAVQISPPNDHMAGEPWYTRYQPVTYELVSRSGDAAAFADMVRRCKSVGVGIYADAVINHIAAGSGTSIGGKAYGNRSTPIYSQNDMHHCDVDAGKNCNVTNYRDKHNVQFCDLLLLPDLCTGCEYVQKTVSDYLNNMADIGIMGFRIDAGKHIDIGDLNQLLSRVNSSLWKFGEVISGQGEAVSPCMYLSIMHVTEFNYARKLSDNFVNGKLRDLYGFGESWGLIPSNKAVVFVDNHDTQRGEAKLTYKNGDTYQLASIFMLAHPYGYPKIMSSYYFDSFKQGPPRQPVHGGEKVNCFGGKQWVCEHRWTPIANMVGWRLSAGTDGITSFLAPADDTIAFCRGNNSCVAMNRQSKTWSGTLKLSMPAGKYCDVFQSDDTSACPTVLVDDDGSVSLQVQPYKAVAFHVGKKASESGIV